MRGEKKVGTLGVRGGERKGSDSEVVVAEVRLKSVRISAIAREIRSKSMSKLSQGCRGDGMQQGQA